LASWPRFGALTQILRGGPPPPPSPPRSLRIAADPHWTLAPCWRLPDYTPRPGFVHHTLGANTHRMPKVAGHVSPKGPLRGKRATNYWALLPQREMTYEDKAPYASTPACNKIDTQLVTCDCDTGYNDGHHAFAPAIAGRHLIGACNFSPRREGRAHCTKILPFVNLSRAVR